MLDLSHKACLEFWRSYPDPSLYRVVAFMDSVEDWTLDGHPAVEAGIQQLGVALGVIGRTELKLEEEFVELVAYIKTSRGLRILMALDSAVPGSASKVIMHAEKNNRKPNHPAAIFLPRNIAFERFRLLGRVFAPERAQLILRALEE
ncbi:MAG: phosphoesterase [Gammaproteobacteria bacterium RIFCSPHIGHO2_12_FULL_45_9]|nr:MAG: phosphoesterase [Gammaproteobacteria bacterium RIFCSPHIGHO2_12_FULL_45_9]